MKIDALRKDYKYSELSQRTIHKNPIKQFATWLEDAINSGIAEPTAMSVSTYGMDGFPQSRIVLLKFYNENGFVFFTNYNSQKGKSLEKNPSVGILFFWPELERQVRISGFAEKTDQELSEKYFNSRPFTSQIGAIVSEQSNKITSRKYLDERFKNLLNRYKNKKPQKPDNWGGYIIKPEKIEFWQGRKSRLHDRIIYEKINNSWAISRLAP